VKPDSPPVSEPHHPPVDDPTPPAAGPTLADRDDDQDERGRIGYGRNERLSSYLLGALLVLVIGAIGMASWLRGGDDGGVAVRQPAPDYQMATFDGSTFNLADYRGKVVVMNIWASWCDPCREEMPALQAASERYGEDVVFVGVGAKADRDDEARAFAAEFGITYPIGRDTEGGNAGMGQIGVDYGVVGYPTTYFIDPDGNIAVTVIQALDMSQLDAYIERARQT